MDKEQNKPVEDRRKISSLIFDARNPGMKVMSYFRYNDLVYDVLGSTELFIEGGNGLRLYKVINKLQRETKYFVVQKTDMKIIERDRRKEKVLDDYLVIEGPTDKPGEAIRKAASQFIMFMQYMPR